MKLQGNLILSLCALLSLTSASGSDDSSVFLLEAISFSSELSVEPIVNLNDILDGTVTACKADRVGQLLRQTFERRELDNFYFLLVKFPEEISCSLDSKDLKDLYQDIWKSHDGNKYLDLFLDDQRCNNGHLVRALIDLTKDDNASRPVLNKKRLESIQTHCLVTLEQAKHLYSYASAQLVKQHLADWIKLLEAQYPIWPLSEILSQPKKGSIRIANIAAYYSKRGHRYMVPAINANSALNAPNHQLLFGEKFAAILKSFPLSNDEKLKCRNRKSLIKTIENKVTQVVKNNDPVSFGYFIYRSKYLTIRTGGQIGVWIVRIIQNDEFTGTELETLCDSIWSNGKCNEWHSERSKKKGAMFANGSYYFILMGDAKLLARKPRLDLEGLLSYSTVESFDETMNLFLTAYNPKKSSNSDRPVAIGTLLFQH